MRRNLAGRNLGLDAEGGWYKTADVSGYRLYRVRSVLARRRTPFQRAEILEIERLGRCLFLDGEIQSAEADEFIYHELLVHPAMLVHPAPRRVLVCGAGECMAVREVLRYPQVELVVAVDIDREVVELCLEHLGSGLPADPRCELVFADVAEYVRRYQGEPFDVAIVDVTDEVEGPAGSVHAPGFYKALEGVVASPGAVAVQGTSACSGLRSAGFGNLYRILTQVFGRVLPYTEYIPSFDDLWGFFLCLKGIDDARPRREPPPGLRYYDEEARRRAFSLTRPLRKSLGIDSG